MKITPIHTFLTHLRPHLDEIASYWILKRWGDAFFPGVSDSQIRYLTTGVLPDEIPPDLIVEKGILPVGVGGGPLDEHPSPFEGRKTEECAATLTIKTIEKQDDVVLARVAREILHCDLTNQVRSTQLSTLIKLRHRRNSNAPQKVLDWAMKGLDGLYGSGAVFVPDEAGENNLVIQNWKQLIAEHGWDNQKCFDHIETLLMQTKGKANFRLTELAHLFRILYKSNRDEALLWLREALIDMYHDSCEFFKAVDEINAKGEVVEFKADRLTFPVVAIHSDTEHISLAARSRFCGYNALVIQRNTKGNTAIFLNVHNEHVRQERLRLDNLIRMIRLREQTRLGHPQGLWRDLGVEGTLRRIRMWYYAKDGDVILNGCLTTPDVKPSKLALKEVLGISQSAFSRDLVSDWRRKHAFLSDNQVRKGTFRHRPRRLQSEYGLFNVGNDYNHTTESLPSFDDIEAELERIMVNS